MVDSIVKKNFVPQGSVTDPCCLVSYKAFIIKCSYCTDNSSIIETECYVG